MNNQNPNAANVGARRGQPDMGMTPPRHLWSPKTPFSLGLMRLSSKAHMFDKLPLFDSGDGKPPIALKPEAPKNT